MNLGQKRGISEWLGYNAAIILLVWMFHHDSSCFYINWYESYPWILRTIFQRYLSGDCECAKKNKLSSRNSWNNSTNLRKVLGFHGISCARAWLKRGRVALHLAGSRRSLAGPRAPIPVHAWYTLDIWVFLLVPTIRQYICVVCMYIYQYFSACTVYEDIK